MSETREALIVAATAVVQARGYNGLSFRELAGEVGIKSASVYHHFPTKAELVAALVRRYRQDAVAAFESIRAKFPDASSCVRCYAMGFRVALENDNRMCLCGLLGAEYHELPGIVQSEVQAFVDDNVTWLASVLSPAHVEPAKTTRGRAFAIYSAISGAQLTARIKADSSAFDALLEAYYVAGLLPTS